MDVNSRFKLIAYSREETWANGLCWYLWRISLLRSHGVSCQIIFAVDHGEEFGGKSWLKIIELMKLIRGFGCWLIENQKGHSGENAHWSVPSEQMTMSSISPVSSVSEAKETCSMRPLAISITAAMSENTLPWITQPRSLI